MNTNAQTTPTTKKQVIESLTALNLDGFTPEFLNGLELPQLVTLLDNSKVLKNEKNKTVRSNVALNVLNNLLESNTMQVTPKELNTLVRRFNLDNYFNLPENYNFVSVARTNADALLNVITSNKDDKTNSERLNNWLERSKNYINSHLIGKSIKGNLYLNKDSDYYFTFDKVAKVYNVTAKND